MPNSNKSIKAICPKLDIKNVGVPLDEKMFKKTNIEFMTIILRILKNHNDCIIIWMEDLYFV